MQFIIRKSKISPKVKKDPYPSMPRKLLLDFLTTTMESRK
jgi:hypothetical protein